jgi:gluconate 5-dehydrogenase
MTLDLFSLQGKTALVTGATQGLGMSMAKALAGAGARVVINGHSCQEKLTAAVQECRAEGLAVEGLLFDVTDPVAVETAVAEIERSIGPIDILINNAGIIHRIPLLEMPLQAFEQVINTNLTGVFTMTVPVAKRMITRGAGKIINVCSMMSELGRDNVGAYAAAKGGLKMLTKNMATEWARFNIQVNGIGPGYFATPQTASLRTPGHPFNDFIVSRTPAARWGNMEDLHGAAIFLAAKASDFVTGHIIYVDGGILATIGRPMENE